jgi:mRNA interferase RelE/StbE
MGWTIELDKRAVEDLDKLDPQIARRIMKFLNDRVAPLENPRMIGQALTGSKLGALWRYRVGDYPIIADIQDERLTILAVAIGHRSAACR